MLEVPSWAWGLVVMVLAGTGGLLIKSVSHYLSRIETKVDAVPPMIASLERRVEERFRNVEHRLTVVEVKRHGNERASGM